MNVAIVWLVFELSLVRDSSFTCAWRYVLVMLAVGAAYLVGLLVRRSRGALTLPDMHGVGTELDNVGWLA